MLCTYLAVEQTLKYVCYVIRHCKNVPLARSVKRCNPDCVIGWIEGGRRQVVAMAISDAISSGDLDDVTNLSLSQRLRAIL